MTGDRVTDQASRPLEGLRVLVTRARDARDELGRALEAEGAIPLYFPVIRIAPTDEPERFAEALGDLREGRYGLVAFTSQNAVEKVVEGLARTFGDARSLESVRVCAVGPATARALTERGVRVDLVPTEHVAEALAQELVSAFGEARPRVLFPRAKKGRETLLEALGSAGFEVDLVTAYVTLGVPGAEGAALLDSLERGEVDVITFTSSSTVSRLLECLEAASDAGRARDALARAKLAAIGPVTGKTLTDAGLSPQITAETYTSQGLCAAIGAYFSEHLRAFPDDR